MVGSCALQGLMSLVSRIFFSSGGGGGCLVGDLELTEVYHGGWRKSVQTCMFSRRFGSQRSHWSDRGKNFYWSFFKIRF